MDQNNSRDQNFAPSFRNDSHISSRNEHRTATPSFQNDSHISFQNEIGTFSHFEETVICYYEGIVIFFRKDRPLSSRKENWRSHINRSLIHHLKGTAYIQSLWDSFSADCFVCDTAGVSTACPYYTQNSRNTGGEKTPLYD